MNTVVVVGSVNMDLIAPVGHLPTPGETVLGADLVARAGGKGGNQAVAAARLGAGVRLFAATGDDTFGTDLRASLTIEGLDLSRVVTLPGVPSGVALIVVAADAQNMIAVSPGANQWLADTHLGGLPEACVGGAVVLFQLEVPRPTCLAAARAARQAGARIVLNAAPLSEPEDPDLLALLACVDVLVVNEGEALQLTRLSSPADPDGWARLADSLRGRGTDTVVITLGEQGAVAAAAGTSLHQEAFPVKVVDTTGAGDAFCGALAVSLARQQTLPEAVRWAAAAGALATTRVGAQAALPTAPELDQFLSGSELNHD